MPNNLRRKSFGGTLNLYTVLLVSEPVGRDVKIMLASC